MDQPRKDLENLLLSLQPTNLSDASLDRLARAMHQDLNLDATSYRIEKSLHSLQPSPLSHRCFEQLMQCVQHTPFAVDEKIVLFPRKVEVRPSVQQSKVRHLLAVAAMALLGGLAAWISPPSARPLSIAKKESTQNQGSLIKEAKNITASKSLSSGIIATSFGSGIEKAADEGVIWTQDHQPHRVLRFHYQDRVLVQDQNGHDRMLFLPREELYLVPEKCD